MSRRRASIIATTALRSSQTHTFSRRHIYTAAQLSENPSSPNPSSEHDRFDQGNLSSNSNTDGFSQVNLQQSRNIDGFGRNLSGNGWDATWEFGRTPRGNAVGGGFPSQSSLNSSGQWVTSNRNDWKDSNVQSSGGISSESSYQQRVGNSLSVADGRNHGAYFQNSSGNPTGSFGAAESHSFYPQGVNQQYVHSNWQNHQNYHQELNKQAAGQQQNFNLSNLETPHLFEQSSGGYYKGGTQEFQQRPSLSESANYQPFPISGGQFLDHSPPHQLPDKDESSGFRGTLEELDKLCAEGNVKDAVHVLGLLEKNSVGVDTPRCLKLVQLCGEGRFVQEAKVIHNHLQMMGDLDVWLNNKILDMYCKCGLIPDAYKHFEKMFQRNLTSWDTMIRALAKSGYAEEALDLFNEFKQKGLKPDGGIFTAVFMACGALGAVDEGLLHFESMKIDYGISPEMEHCISIVDMLGSSGYTVEAFEFVEKMPIEPTVDVWETLMNMCRLNGNLELGNHCAQIVEHLDASRLTEQTKKGLLPLTSSDLEKEKQRKKNANLLVGRTRVHEYRAGDKSHPENDKIYEQIRGLAPQMKEAGYVPETRFVLHDVDQESREEALLYHSERLAVAYGLMTSAARSEMRIIKNLRVCGDCHNALKIISKLVGRRIVARDAKRFHHFENGFCSCKDYW